MEPRIVLSGGIRKVLPYYFHYVTPFKERWRHRAVPSVLCTELGQLPEIVARAIESGDIYVSTNNGKALPKEEIRGEALKSHLLSPHDIIHNRQHIHEPDIHIDSFTNFGNSTDANSGLINSDSASDSDQTSEISETPKIPIPIIFEDDGIIVVNKPAGVPTHPGGIYRYNSMTEIIRLSRGEVWPCHRLDKATSGVLVMAKTKPHCSQYMKQIGHKSVVDKYYLARVRGQFPKDAFQYTFPVFSINSSGGYAQNMTVPIDCTTVFACVQYLSATNESIVLCKPISGKMHQIRIHLRNLGFPISNDAYYNGSDDVNALKSTIEMDIRQRISEKYPALGIFPLPHNKNSTIESESEDPKPFKSLLQHDFESNPMDLKFGSNTNGIVDLRNSVEAAMQDLQSPVLTKFEGEVSIGQFLNGSLPETKALAKLRAQKDIIPDPTLCAECARPMYDKKPDTGIFLHAMMLQEKTGSFKFSAGLPQWAIT